MSVIRLFIDASVFETTLNRGIQRIFIEMLPRLKKLVSPTYGLRGPVQAEIPDGGRCYHAFLPTANQRWQLFRRAVRFVQKWRWENEVRNHDLFHSTYFSLPGQSPVPVVVTVYDMIAESFPDYFSDAGRHVQKKREAIAAAAVCICISESTATELRAFYPEAAGKIRVVYPGCEHLARVTQNQSRQSQRYVLYVGERGRYKNFRLLLSAVAEPNWPAGMELHTVGRPFSEAEALLVARLGLSNRVRHLGRVSDPDLATAYAGAACCVYPSLMEGFGFPVLEAQAAGCPVACSDIPVFREIGGHAPVFFDPHSPHAIAEGIASASGLGLNPAFRDAGQANLSRFSWDLCAEQTLAVYREVLVGRTVRQAR